MLPQEEPQPRGHQKIWGCCLTSGIAEPWASFPSLSSVGVEHRDLVSLLQLQPFLTATGQPLQDSEGPSFVRGRLHHRP